jgi:two-component sensor histidine kinase
MVSGNETSRPNLLGLIAHAFVGRNGGTLTLRSVVDETGCRVIVADDGVGLPEGADWPTPGKLAALIVQSLRQNAGAQVTVESSRGHGVRVSIVFARASAAPDT